MKSSLKLVLETQRYRKWKLFNPIDETIVTKQAQPQDFDHVSFSFRELVFF